MQGLDIQSEAELYDYVRSLPAKYGCAVLMVSHDLQWVMQGTHRVVCLNKHICCSGLPENVQQHPEYQAIFGTNRVFYQHHHDHCAHGDSATPCQHDARPHITLNRKLQVMMEWLQLLLPAWIMGTLLVFLTAPLGCLMLWRRMSFFADTMAHGTLLGVAIAGAMALPLWMGVAFIAGLLVAILWVFA